MARYNVKAKIPMEIGVEGAESEEEAREMIEAWYHAELSTNQYDFPCSPDVTGDIEFKSIDEG